MKLSKSLLWFRRDLRAFDHAALHHALISSNVVYCAFIYDKEILDGLPRQDRRVEFIHACVAELDAELRQLGGYLIVRHGGASEAIAQLAAQLEVGIDWPGFSIRSGSQRSSIRRASSSGATCRS
jgi:deoxyribodipyrimidine photo-lyase